MSAPEHRAPHEMALEASSSLPTTGDVIRSPPRGLHHHHHHTVASGGGVTSSAVVTSGGGGGAVTSPSGGGVVTAMEQGGGGGASGGLQSHEAFQQQIMHLKMQTQLQQQKLLEDYQVRQQQINDEYEHRLKLHLKELWEQQQAAAAQAARDERDRRDRLAASKQQQLVQQQTSNHNPVSLSSQSSASSCGSLSNVNNAASSEVKQKLQVFLMKKREQAKELTNGREHGPGTVNYRNWGVVKSSSGESLPGGSGAGGAAHPYRHPGISGVSSQHPGHMNSPQQAGGHGNVASGGQPGSNDFPLRKTASEPNLLKVRLKQRVIERRASPMASRRHDRLLANIKRKNIANCTINNSPDSGPNSPPALTSRGSPTSAPIQEENEEAGYGVLSGSQQGSLSDLSLFSSPSLPNISLGRPHLQPHNHITPESPMLHEAAVRAAFTARLGAPLTGQLLPGVLPYYPSLPVIEAEPPQGEPPPPQQPGGGFQKPITDTQVAHHHLNKIGAHRPLGRTQSAPLPLGHPMLAGAQPPHTGAVPVVAHAPNAHGEGYTQAERHALDHSLLKQHIRQTVLTRAAGIRHELLNSQLNSHQSQNNSAMTGSASSIMNSAAMQHDVSEVIDLTERKRHHHEINSAENDAEMSSVNAMTEDIYPRSAHSRPLSRALSSPLVHLGGVPPLSHPATSPPVDLEPPVNLSVAKRRDNEMREPTTGLAYDNLMLKHACRCGDNSVHPEHGGRLQSVWARLVETGLASRCERARARKAGLDEIQTCHTEMHTLMFGTNPLSRQKLDMSKLSSLPVKSLVRLPCGGVGVDSDTTWNELHTGPAARMAAGCVIELAYKTATGSMRNGFAVVRPPGHHAEPQQAMGFCFFNSVAIAARLVQERAGLQRVLIVDWDVHHGNGTQQIFYEDRQVLYLSIHRHDDGNFFPGTGSSTECGAGAGLGFTVNVSWSGGLDPPLGDAEYLAAFRTIVMPIARDFAPELVLVSAGFDAAAGHPPPLGGYEVTPACFGHMTRELMTLAGGKLVLSLEGGYDLPAICDSAQECVRALLGDEIAPISQEELLRTPCQNAVDTLQKTIAIQLSHWPCLKRHAHLAGVSFCQAATRKSELVEESDTVTAMAGLSMHHNVVNNKTTPEHSRSVSEEPMEQDDGK